MKFYLVGGALRDKLLQLPVVDCDYVVVGATFEDLLNQGFKQVGADFPVFLHPKTGQEYALARKEKKTGAGYHGFICDFSPDITLKDDLQRRDLTINAIAQDLETGEIFDFYNGIKDLENKILRHISPAFAEDPLRVLRVLRFEAKLSHLGFTIAPETWQLLSQMVLQNQLSELTAERINQEITKVFKTSSPEIFFYQLQKLQAFEQIFKLDLTPVNFDCLKNITNFKKQNNNVALYFSALVLDLNIDENKAFKFCQNLKLSRASSKLVLLANKFLPYLKNNNFDPKKILELLTRLEIYHQNNHKNDFIILAKAYELNSAKIDLIEKFIEKVLQIKITNILKPNLQGAEIHQELTKLRLNAIDQVLKNE